MAMTIKSNQKLYNNIKSKHESNADNVKINFILFIYFF